MKMLKKICTVIAALSLAFGLASCTNIQEDEDLIISIEQDGTVVTLTAPSEYEGNNFKVYIVYALDGDEPSVSNFDSAAYAVTPGDPDTWVSKTGSLLWDRLLQTYTEQIKTRYTYLRNNVINENPKSIILGVKFSMLYISLGILNC